MSPISPGEGALVILLPLEAAQAADHWRRLYDPNVDLIPPHITLAFQFVPAAGWPQHAAAVAKLLAKFAPFPITLEKVSYFAYPSSVLWLKPQDDGAIVRIHTALELFFPNLMPAEPLGFIPHATLGFFNSDEALRQAQWTVQSAFKPQQFVANEAVYLTYNGSRWQVVARLPLQG